LTTESIAEFLVLYIHALMGE